MYSYLALGTSPLLYKHHHHPFPELFHLPKLKHYTNHTKIPPPLCPASGSHRSPFCLHESGCSRGLMEVESQHFCLLRLVFPRFSSVVSENNSFLKLNNIPPNGCATFCVSIHSPTNTGVAFTYWPSWLTLLWTCMCKHLSESLLSIPLGLSPRSGTAGSEDNPVSNLFKEPPYPVPLWQNYLTFLTAVHRDSNFSTSSAILIFSWLIGCFQ